MQPYIPFPQTLRLTIRGSVYGIDIVNVSHHFYTGDPAVAVVTAAALARDSWVSNVLPYLAAPYTAVEVIATDLAAQNGPTSASPFAESTTGGATGELLSPGLCVVLTLRTAKRGRSYRGRVFLGPFTEPQMTDGAWTSAFVANIAGGYTEWHNDLATAGFNQVIASRTENGVDRTIGVSTTVTAIVLRSPRPGVIKNRIDRD